MKWIIGFLLIGFFCFGCSRDDIATIRAQIDAHKQTVTDLAVVASDLQALAEKTGSVEIINAAASAKKALEIANDKIPLMEAELKKMEAGGPWWMIAAAAAWPFVSPMLKAIPGPGGVAATFIGNLLYTLNATRAVKERDKAAEAALKQKETSSFHA